MQKRDLISCYETSPLILTEGAVGLRISHEFGIIPDRGICNASLIYGPAGRGALETIYRQYLQAAEDYALPILLMTNTRRANRERMDRSPYKGKNVISDYAEFLRELTGQYGCEAYVGGIIGCKGDAYTGEGALTVEEAMAFHEWQVNEFEKANVDFVFEAIMPAVSEMIGISKLIERRRIPYIASFMVRQNGRIIDGHTVHGAITEVDAALNCKPLCYMANCVHPDILRSALRMDFNDTATVRTRFKGLQANAACAQPEDLDFSQEVHSSDADELANSFRLLNGVVPMKICGGCCGTDDSHIRAIAQLASDCPH